VPRHGIQVGAGPEYQPVCRERPNSTCRALGIVLYGGHWEHQVGMAIDEAGHDHPARSVDFDGFPRLGKILQPPARPDFDYDAITHQNSAVRYYTEIFSR
jgi:hypothetical protein